MKLTSASLIFYVCLSGMSDTRRIGFSRIKVVQFLPNLIHSFLPSISERLLVMWPFRLGNGLYLIVPD